MRLSYLPRSMLRVWELSSPLLGQSPVPDGAVPVLNIQSSESSQEQPNGDHYYKFTAFWVQDQGKWRVAAWVTSTDPKNLRVP